MKKTERFKAFMAYFEENMPVAETELLYSNPYELLVSVILSAQCTDKRVNMITPSFFRRFPDVGSLASAEKEEVFELVKSCSYPNNKSLHLLNMARMVMEKFGGVIPDNTEDLQKLPGVGRKTAHVMVSVIYNQPKMAVDTHVFRVAARIGLTTGAKNPLQTELQLVKHIPEEKIPLAHHWLILHGRYVCRARNPACDECGMKPYCRFYEKLSKRQNLT
ncbi:MAG TPA: endonuclease III [Bacteroidales bacterium]|nr:endonuclease III [Bacteroidales bacterium]HNQ82233.1 endonuclease III [Bacteroidales bacterium]HOX78010.1 endonuclease III [Bacteroidales bacterium]HPI84975.1 endonuclease III [Bacteroidales bacterium]HPM91679.1 endonuclease III [Bacteroidales bacterium]